jgi:ribonuclease P protein component
LQVKTPSLSFRQTQRIKKPSVFKQIFSQSSIKCSERFVLLLAVKSPIDTARLGIVVSKRNFRRAHERNYLKRMIRESFRHHQTQLDALDILIIPRRDMLHLPRPDIHIQMAKLWSRLENRLKTF